MEFGIKRGIAAYHSSKRQLPKLQDLKKNGGFSAYDLMPNSTPFLFHFKRIASTSFPSVYNQAGGKS